MTLIIGLTGGIGSGKSTVATLFAERGVPVFDTDAIARELVSSGKPALDEIIKTFGPEMLDDKGKLDRAALKQKIFDSDTSREQLESILHPRIRKQLLAAIRSVTAPYCIAIIPLLIEKNWQEIVDRVLVVDVPKELQVTRTASRDKLSHPLIRQIMATQVKRNQRLQHADDIIDNSTDEAALTRQVEELHARYLALSKHADGNE